MALRMLRYVVRLMEHWRQEHPESEQLPVILPLVMYHGEDGAWTAARRVEDLFALPGEAQEEQERWRALVPRFEYLLDDLTAERSEALLARPGPPLVRLTWLLLRYSRSEELARKLREWVALFVQVLAEQEGNEQLKTILHYLLWIGDEAVRDATRQVLDSVVDAQRAEELMRSYGEELMERGRLRGREEGLLRGRAEAVLRLLTGRGLHVDEASRQLILSCSDVATLDLWIDRAIHATSLSEVLAPPSQ
jgi:hypothetical protein